MKKVLYLLMMVAVCTTAGVAQAPQGGGKVPPAEVPAAPQPATSPAAFGDPVNVRYEITIRETGGMQTSPKTVNLVLAMNEQSSVRANGLAASRASHALNVDVMPMNLRDNRVRTRIVFEYTPSRENVQGPPPFSMRQTLNVWLDSGKPLVVSEAADPVSDRRFTVSVTATVIR